MAECHPVGFQWVMAAKQRGAAVIHVDPRFTRTSALTDRHVPLRAGTDIAFLGGLINYVLQGGHEFREYLLAYTNAPAIVGEDFRDTEDLAGLFSGYDPQTRSYQPESWQYQGATAAAAAGDRQVPMPAATGAGAQRHGAASPPLPAKPELDLTLTHPRCVYQILKRHFSRYTPELVERVCGVPPADFLAVAEAVTRNSGRERTTAWVYSVG